MAIHKIMFSIDPAIKMYPYLNDLPIIHGVGTRIIATDNNVQFVRNKYTNGIRNTYSLSNFLLPVCSGPIFIHCDIYQ